MPALPAAPTSPAGMLMLALSSFVVELRLRIDAARRRRRLSTPYPPTQSDVIQIASALIHRISHVDVTLMSKF
ncbi:hypothetical protein B0H16DRAFT_158280 [Mycena metata]|uniref:Uncharacterized protein n=1 Tax=Mycena metata TaxID=1033252 RepID=A0AAD7MV26_9AGAR|nr:hypothetical protein B0H16DRAFT_158280 [Mycena metata]